MYLFTKYPPKQYIYIISICIYVVLQKQPLRLRLLLNNDKAYVMSVSNNIIANTNLLKKKSLFNCYEKCENPRSNNIIP